MGAYRHAIYKLKTRKMIFYETDYHIISSGKCVSYTVGQLMYAQFGLLADHPKNILMRKIVWFRTHEVEFQGPPRIFEEGELPQQNINYCFFVLVTGLVLVLSDNNYQDWWLAIPVLNLAGNTTLGGHLWVHGSLSYSSFLAFAKIELWQWFGMARKW